MVTRVRPTLRVLKTLPTDGEDILRVLGVLERARRVTDVDARRSILDELRLDDMRHPLLDDLRDVFDRGAIPGRHESSSKIVGRTVYEARSRTGAGWRGAATLDDGVIWLVFADVHDRFHATAADYFMTGTWEPRTLDRELAAQDAVRAGLRQWRVQALSAILDGLAEAVRRDDPVSVELSRRGPDDASSLVLKVEHDPPAVAADQAHTTSGMLAVTVRIKKNAGFAATQAVLGLLALVHAGGEQDQSFLPGGDLIVLATLSHARLAQLTAQILTINDAAPDLAETVAPSALHYVGREALAAGLVTGAAVLSLCGEWFVPRHDESAGLPVCAACEKREPLAQALLDELRSRTS